MYVGLGFHPTEPCRRCCAIEPTPAPQLELEPKLAVTLRGAFLDGRPLSYAHCGNCHYDLWGGDLQGRMLMLHLASDRREVLDFAIFVSSLGHHRFVHYFNRTLEGSQGMGARALLFDLCKDGAPISFHMERGK